MWGLASALSLPSSRELTHKVREKRFGMKTEILGKFLIFFRLVSPRISMKKWGETPHRTPLGTIYRRVGS